MKEKFIKLIKKRRLQIYCIAAGFLLYALAIRFAKTDGYLVGGNYLPRKSYGQGSSSYELYVDGLTEDEAKVDILIDERQYKAGEINQAFEKTMGILTTSILGDNASLSEVAYDLKLPSKVEATGVKIMWYTDSPKLVWASGEVHNEDLATAADAVLTAELKSNSYTESYAIPITVIPRIMNDDERLIDGLKKEITNADKKQITDGGIKLPTTYDGKSISYREDTTSNYNAIWALGIVAALLLYARERAACKEELQHKDRQMLVDYPEIVSKLTVYIGAGMAVRPAWGEVVADYEAHSEDKKRYAYEEMTTSWYQLKSGISEARVYKEFGRRCKLKQYMKLASLIDQNRKSGVAGLKQLLEVESVEAWEERKNSAKRLGEEASTRLLMPLFIMLGIVMIMIMLPAFMSFY